MRRNDSLNKAIANRRNEFFTQADVIEDELRHYTDQFKGLSVLCNCNDADREFARYFEARYKELELSGLVCTSYSPDGNGEIWSYNGEIWSVSRLSGNGGFDTPECTSLLEACDIVVTNPPFSLLSDFISLLIRYNKKFIIIGNINAVTYKNIFPLIKDNKMWLGASIHSGDRAFSVPEDYPLEATGCGVDDQGKRFIRVTGVRWFTNMDYPDRHRPIEITSEYDSMLYPRYDNYDAIDVSRVRDIPKGYDGEFGVPVTFLDKYSPEQFKIVYELDAPYINGKRMYKRLIIRFL